MTRETPEQLPMPKPGESHVAREWDLYRRTVLPADAGDVQVSETRRAFYAGVFSLFTTFVALGQYPDDEGEAVLAGILRECHAFNADVAAGRA